MPINGLKICDPRRIGLAVTLQFAVGYALTLPTIYVVPALVGARDEHGVAEADSGWAAAWSVLAVGPLISALATMWPRQLPSARRLAGGKR